MEIRKIAVIGAGQMGAGIAQVAAGAGLDVVLIDAAEGLAAAGKVKIGAQLEKQVAKGKLAPADRVGSSRVDLQACKLEYSIVSPK